SRSRWTPASQHSSLISPLSRHSPTPTSTPTSSPTRVLLTSPPRRASTLGIVVSVTSTLTQYSRWLATDSLQGWRSLATRSPKLPARHASRESRHVSQFQPPQVSRTLGYSTACTATSSAPCRPPLAKGTSTATTS
ncbi:hypothetical protein BXZ70DRAFT_976722, partial [Cristinia sonorae]